MVSGGSGPRGIGGGGGRRGSVTEVSADFSLSYCLMALLCSFKLPLFHSEGIYKVECLCGKCYIGQTGRSIQCRLKEHSRAIKQYDKEKSALAEHKFEDGDHTFDLEKTVVLAKTSKYHQRLIREAIEIRKNPNNFNRDQGVELSSTWNSVIRPCTHPPTNFSHRATPTTPTTNPTGTTPTTNSEKIFKKFYVQKLNDI
jgi:hypothetical protein